MSWRPFLDAWHKTGCTVSKRAALPPAPRVVLMTLAECAVERDGAFVCSISAAQIAERSGISARTLTEHLKTLEGKGYLKVERRADRNYYTVTV